ncbi:hypothetical protein [Pseudomonas sichuanensis]|uniref:Uncharacterized protein n=1 Tax=Pseudomonas sichuanensis TaxID=2213015 RepID=A0ABV0DFB5_9PSED
MNPGMIRRRFSEFGIHLSEDEIRPFMSFEITPNGERIWQRISRLESAVKSVLEREGKYGAYENFYGISDLLTDFDIDELSSPSLAWRRSLIRTYKKCFDVVHYYGAGGAWVFLLGDVMRPIDDPQPLIVDLIPSVIDIHPAQISSSYLDSLSQSVLTDVSNLLKSAISELSAKLPDGIDIPPNTSSAEDIKAWYESSRIKLQEKLNELTLTPNTPERAMRAQAITVALKVIIEATTYYGLVKPIFDIALERLAAKAEADKRAIEARRQEYEKELGPFPHEIPHGSDYIDAFEHNQDVISHTA